MDYDLKIAKGIPSPGKSYLIQLNIHKQIRGIFRMKKKYPSSEKSIKN